MSNQTLDSLTLDEVRQELSHQVGRLSLVRAHRDGRVRLDLGGWNSLQHDLRVDELEDDASRSLEECNLWLERWNAGERD